jgi:hypothetical protein
VEAAYGDRSLSSSQIYRIIKQVRARKNTDDQRHLNLKKTVRSANLIASEAAAVADDRRIDTRSLSAAHGVCLRTICQILKEDLGLVKKSARWVPKRTCAHCRRSLQLVHCPQHPVARTPTLFA